MMKTLKQTFTQDKERYSVPRKVQDVIPIRRIWDDGIFQVGNRFAKTYKFTDINYLVASPEDKKSMFLTYSELLNSFDSVATTKITINNRRLNRKDFEEAILMPMQEDGLDDYRREYNKMLLDKVTGANGIMQEKYITISVAKNYICPDSIEKNSDYLKLGEKYCRVIFLKDYASYIKDDMLTELTDLNRNLMMSIDIIPVPTDEAVREVERILLGVETNITNWQRRQNANQNFSAVIPYDMEQQRNEIKEFLNDLTTRDQRMMFAVITLIHMADTKEQLDSDTEAILATARKQMCQLATMKYQQLDGLNTVLPIGLRKINAMRTLTTESLAMFMPFKVQEIQEVGGIFFGENAISHNLILCNMANLLNQSMFLLGIPGSGKSFFAKLLIIFLALATNDDIIICDPEGEYTPLIQAIGKQNASVIRIAAGGRDRINAMDMVEGYGDNNPIVDKAQFIMSLIEQIDPSGVGAHHKSIIDRCTDAVYKEQAQTCKVPTLCTLREKLLEQPEQEAHDLALALELFTSGSLDVFAHETNVDTSSRIISYDIHDLGAQLKPAGLLTITDAMLNRVTTNWKKGKRTHLFIDEFHVVYENEFSANFFNSAWRQFRKRNTHPCAITQNVEYLLDSVQASTMLSNSEFVVMLNQAASDRTKLSELLNISTEQMSYITNADAGCGLMKYGASLVPFVNKFPKNTELYKLITTRPGEGVMGGQTQ